MTLRNGSIGCCLVVAAALASAGADAQRLSTACFDHEGSADPEPPSRLSTSDSLHAEIHAEFRTELRRAAVAAGVAEPGGYLVLEHDRRTGRATHRLVRGNVPERVIADAHRRMSTRLSESPRREPVVFFGMRLDPETWLEGPVGPMTVNCEPELVQLRTVQGRLSAVMERVAPNGNPPISTVLRMLVTRDGEVAYAHLLRPTGILALDRELVRRVATSLRFAPARVGERALDIWVELPIELPARAPPPPPGPEPVRWP